MSTSTLRAALVEPVEAVARTAVEVDPSVNWGSKKPATPPCQSLNSLERLHLEHDVMMNNGEGLLGSLLSPWLQESLPLSNLGHVNCSQAQSLRVQHQGELRRLLSLSELTKSQLSLSLNQLKLCFYTLQNCREDKETSKALVIANLFGNSLSNMEAEISSANQMRGIFPRLFAAVGPVLLISMGYVDPGKWAAAVEGGARFGFDPVLLILVFNFAAVLCQYLAARIGVVTGRNLAGVSLTSAFCLNRTIFVFMHALIAWSRVSFCDILLARDDSWICSEEYNKSTCILLGVQAELSMIALDLTMILGISNGLNLIFGVDLFTCVFLTAIDAFLFPLFATLLENCKAKFVCICMAGFIFIFYVLGVLISQPEIPLVMNGMLTMINGESAFALMSLLGANIMPHNFYFHSSIVQRHLGPPNVSKGALCHDHFFAILCVFSGIFLVNYVLVNSAASVFHSTGLVVCTFQDALMLMDQVFRSPVATFAFFLVLFFSSQITTLTWNVGGQEVLRNFFRMDLPCWLHRATIRILAIFPALYCVWNSGAEGMYQLLIFTQVILAMLLPSSVIPLFRVSSSRSIMGTYKIPQLVEFLALTTFIGMLGLNIIFVVEMLFGDSDWVGNLKWNIGSSMALPYVVLLITACASMSLMLWLLATPLKSESFRPDAQIWNWDLQKDLCKPSVEREENDLSKTRYLGEEDPAAEEPVSVKSPEENDLGETRYHGEEDPATEEPVSVKSPEENDLSETRYQGEEHTAEESASVKSLGSRSDNSVMDFDLDLPETIMDSDPEPHLASIEENHAIASVPSSLTCHMVESVSTDKSVPVSIVVNEVSDGGLLDATLQNIESVDPVGKILGVEEDSRTEKDDEKDDDERETWDPEESSTGIPGSGPSSTSEGPGSFRSLSWKSDEGGSNGGESLSRLSGLGRAARRRLAAILDEFWGQLYDFHGQATQEVKAKKLDVLFGVDPKPGASLLKLDLAGTDCSGYFPSVGVRGPDFLINSGIPYSPKQRRMPSSTESYYRAQTGSPSSWSTHMQLLDPYVQNSSHNVLNPSERRYSSLRLLPSSDGWDSQPATVHGYQIASYLSRIGMDRSSNSLSGALESPNPKSASYVPTSYRNSLAYALGQKQQNGSVHAFSLQNQVISRNSQLQVERPYYDLCSSGPIENVGSPAYTKKYHSLPDISDLSVSHRDSYLSDRSAQCGSPIGFGPSVGKTTHEQSLYSNTGSRAGFPLAFDEVSPSMVYRDALSVKMSSNSNTGSLWSRQPFEQLFGVAGKTHSIGGGAIGSRPSFVPEATSHVDFEAKLLQSFRYCIMKLLKLEGSDWLFRQNDGADEDLIDQVAARERFHYEAEIREVSRVVKMGAAQYPSSDRKLGSALKNDKSGLTNYLISSVPHCGDGCIWQVDLIVSFGVWCIHRILELSLMESRPELWGKYTYVLNRLQGILDLAFIKPWSPLPPCFCFQVPVASPKRSSPPLSNGLLPPAVKPGRGKCTTAATLLDIIKDIEIAVSCRKGRMGTAAGDVAFPKGKENLVSVLKRYKRRLSHKSTGTHEGGSMLRKIPVYGTNQVKDF
ncbi:hypothetical protein HHK36_016630 [Tetracentron sinense]|uniref:Ethylene-insensitive protein 2 n=1 Tax=Tetracentron sinense TaxID=13715 RepID=A0A835DBP5_TETSI|nr:hypothetical protein HHK36_016630 [Tetracentron sinense]